MERWFHSGTFMNDGTSITIAARSELEAERCLKQGLTPLEKERKGKKPASGASSRRVTRKK